MRSRRARISERSCSYCLSWAVASAKLLLLFLHALHQRLVLLPHALVLIDELADLRFQKLQALKGHSARISGKAAR